MSVVKIDSTTVGVMSEINPVAADESIPYIAIMSDAPMEVYDSDAPGSTLNWPADEPMVVNPNYRLSSTTLCFTFGERSV